MWIWSQQSILYEYTSTAARVRHADLLQACVILARNSSYWSQIRRQVLYLDGLQSLLHQIMYKYCLVFYAQAALCIFVEYHGHIYDSYHFVSVLCVKIVSCHRRTVTNVSRQQITVLKPWLGLHLCWCMEYIQPTLSLGKGSDTFASRKEDESGE